MKLISMEEQKMRHRTGWILTIFVIGLLIILVNRNTVPEYKAEVWLTTEDRSHLLSPQASAVFADDNGNSLQVIDVNPDVRYQTMDGFGAAVTGSSAYLINQKMSSAGRDALIEDLFTSRGIGLNFIRHTIGASDYSVDQYGNPSSYTYDDIPSGTDYELQHFSIEKDKEVIRLLKAAVDKNKSIKVLGTPWTAPPWMKYGSQTYNGWYLNYMDPRIYETYANYFVRYIHAFAQNGIPIYAITVQNEPEFSTPDYPSMNMSAPEQAMFIREYLGPAFTRNRIPAKIIAFDHNWDKGVSYTGQVLSDSGASQYIDGTAFHCYGGTSDAMTSVHRAFPSKHVYFTECSGGEWSTDFGDNLSWFMSNLIIGAPRNWAKSVLLWNIALDPDGGPKNGGCGNCRGVVTVDPKNGAVTKNVEYFAIGHSSKFVLSGATRIDSTNDDGSIETVAYENPDGSIVLIAVNTGPEATSFNVRWKAKSFAYTLPSQSAVTFRWNSSVD
ncbi:beta-1,6-glucanase [Paenibacillus sp. LPE1-1-1.1]